MRLKLNTENIRDLWIYARVVIKTVNEVIHVVVLQRMSRTCS